MTAAGQNRLFGASGIADWPGWSRLAAHSIAFGFRYDSHRFTGGRCGLLGRRDVLAGADGFCSRAQGLLEKQLP